MCAHAACAMKSEHGNYPTPKHRSELCVSLKHAAQACLCLQGGTTAHNAVGRLVPQLHRAA
jgi:hypothetical protein